MKAHKNKIEQEVERTMGSLDRRERLTGNPWLYARIQQRISEKENQRIPGVFSLGKLQPLFFAALLLLNIWTAYTVFNTSTTGFNISATDEEYIDELAAEYSTDEDIYVNYYIEE